MNHTGAEDQPVSGHAGHRHGVSPDLDMTRLSAALGLIVSFMVVEVLVGIAPVTLGGGAPLLPRRLTAADLELVDAARDKQFVRLSYRLRG